MSKDYKLFIDGTWQDAYGGKRFPTYNPYSGEEWATIAQAQEDDVRAAIASARHAFDTVWSKTAGVERAAMLWRLAESLNRDADRMGRLETTDNGKVIRETVGQMRFSARQYQFYAGFADKLWGSVLPLDQAEVFDYLNREPIGVAVLITAWNSPMVLLANKLAPALAAGNCVVIKPSEHASATTLEFCELVKEAGFPPGVVNVVTGGASTGKALVRSEGINLISFTGSTRAGRMIAAAAGQNLVPVTLELGGKSPNIVFADAEPEKAVVGALAGIFGATGQTCIAASRLLVQRPICGKLVASLVDRARKIVLGDPIDPKTEMGTVANKVQFDKVLEYIALGEGEGARLVTGGKPATGERLGNGLFIQPTIFDAVGNDMRIAQEEIFGPVLSVIPFDDEDEAVEIANATRYGLAAGVWTQDISRAMRMSRKIKAGTVWVNTYRTVSCQAPVGGTKESGFGRERGALGLEPFTSYKNVMVDFSETSPDPFAQRS